MRHRIGTRANAALLVIVGLSLALSACAGAPGSGPSRQPVLIPGDSVGWFWQLSAQAPGTAHIWLVATTYDQNSNISLHETEPIEITVQVTATPGYWATRIGNWTKGLIGLVGFGALVTALGWIWRRLRRKKAPVADPDQGDKTPAAPSSA